MKKLFLALTVFLLLGYIGYTNKGSNTVTIHGVDSTEVIVDSVLNEILPDTISIIKEDLKLVG